MTLPPRTFDPSDTTAHQRKVAIIGAGVSGVLCGSVLKQDGHMVTIFETSSRIGGIWADGLYPGARLQNVWAHYHHPDVAPKYHDCNPDTYSPSGPEVQAYFEDCAKRFELNIRLETRVVSMTEQSNGWCVTYSNKRGVPKTEEFDFVVIAQGHYNRDDIQIPWKGVEVFRKAGGTILTRKQITDLKRLKDKKVVVIGYGKTSVDMCTFAVDHGAKSTTHVFRSARTLIPHSICGVHYTWLLFNRLNNEIIPCWDHAKRGLRVLHEYFPALFHLIWWVIQQVAWLFQTRSAWFVKDREIRRRIKLLKSKSHILRDHRVAAAICPTSFFPFVTAGKILPVQGSIKELNSDGLVLEDGRIIEADVILACVGMGKQVDCFPYLPSKYQELVSRATAEDRPTGLQLYRHMITPDIPNVAFMGWNAGFLHCVHVYLGSIWLSCMIRGELTLPPEKEQRQVIDRIAAWKRNHIHYEPNLNSAVHTRLFHYNDTLVQDLGLSPSRKKGFVSELVERYGASDYRGALELIQNARDDQVKRYLENPETVSPRLQLRPVIRDM